MAHLQWRIDKNIVEDLLSTLYTQTQSYNCLFIDDDIHINYLATFKTVSSTLQMKPRRFEHTLIFQLQSSVSPIF